MTHVVAIELENWFRFKGKHRIELKPGCYAVVARAEDDVERSNWIGKSTFLASMPFVLEGWHPAREASGWITPGETQGAVIYHLSDGATIHRFRQSLRSATQLIYTSQGHSQQGEPAQQAIRAAYGTNETDLFMACFYKQKEMARLLAMDPAARMQLVSDWLELAPLQKAEETCGLAAATATQTLSQTAHELARVRAEIERLSATSPNELAAACDLHAEAEAEVTRLQSLIQVNAERHALQRDAGEFARINERGLALKHDLQQLGEEKTPAELEVIRKIERDAVAKLGAKQQEHRQVQVTGAFDGRCPVAGIACPAKQQINTDAEQARQLKQRLAEELEELREDTESTVKTRRDFEQQVQHRAKLAQELVGLRPRALQLIDAPTRLAQLGGAPVDTAGQQLDAAQRNLALAAKRVFQLEAEAKELERLHVAEERLTHEQQGGEHVAKLHRTGVLVYKAAQRVVAEGTMALIERDTNQLLSDSGIDLGVKVTWAREGNQPAKSCDQCGAGFPVSAKAKQCAVCGAARGRHMVEKLEIGTTSISGAAEDLAGIAIRLAASAWLRARKGVGWSSAMIDEPFGALDQANKRALAQQLNAMLSGSAGFAQAFVVAHDRGIMDSLPNRIELIGGKEGTRFGNT